MKFIFSLCATIISTATATSTPEQSSTTAESIQVPKISVDSFLYPYQDKEFIDVWDEFYYLAFENAKEILEIADGYEDEYSDQQRFKDMIDVLIVNYYNTVRGSKQHDIIVRLQNLSPKNRKEFMNTTKLELSRECDLSFVKLKRIPHNLLMFLNPEKIRLVGTGISEGLEVFSHINCLTTLYLDNNNFVSLAELNKLPAGVTTVSITSNPLEKYLEEGNVDKKSTIKTIILSPIKDELIKQLRQRFENVDVAGVLNETEAASAVQHTLPKHDDLEQMLNAVREMCATVIFCGSPNANPALSDGLSENGSPEYQKLMEEILRLIRLGSLLSLSITDAMKNVINMDPLVLNYVRSSNARFTNANTNSMDAVLLNQIMKIFEKTKRCLEFTKNIHSALHINISSIKTAIEANTLSDATEVARVSDMVTEIDGVVNESKRVIEWIENIFMKSQAIIEGPRC